MRKLLVLLAAVALVVAFTVPATAFESEFGGYWRTRAYSQTDFSGKPETITTETTYAIDDDEDSATFGEIISTDTDVSDNQDLTQVDTRLRLYYTAKFSDDLKVVNKFEGDATYGLPEYGDIGADGKVLEIKNSYVDFNLQPFNFKLGVQGTAIARGFLFDDDHAGLVVAYKGETVTVPIIWIKVYEGGVGKDANDQDVDYYAISPSFKLGALSINPYILTAKADKASTDWGKLDLTWIGVDVDATLGAVSWWLTAISESGSTDSTDVSATLFALGASVPLGPASLHAQLFTATGDDAATADIEGFMVPAGQCYYWSEIMGYGTFDNQVSAGSPDCAISNIMAYNIGASFKPMDKMTITVDLWTAKLNEVAAGQKDDLGTEIDLKLTYNFLDNMTLDVIAAQLQAGEATGDGTKDPTEYGAQLSIAF